LEEGDRGGHVPKTGRSAIEEEEVVEEEEDEEEEEEEEEEEIRYMLLIS